MARPKKERELSNTHIISLRLADIDMELLEEVRKKTNYTRSEYIRELIRGHTVKQEIHIQVTDDVLSTFARSLQDICFRLNRIEKYFDTGGLRSLAMEDAIHQCIYDSNFAHVFCLCTLKIQYLAVIQLSKFRCYAA